MRTTRLFSLILGLLFFSNVASAQLFLGPGVAYGTEAEQIGIQARGIYGFSDAWRAQADFTYYLVEEGLGYSEINVNGNYVFSNSDAAKIYALAGLNLTTISVDLGQFGDASVTETGINLGAGVNLGLGANNLLFGEARYVLSDFDQLTLAVGILFGL